MKQILFVVMLLSLLSCNKHYEVIDHDKFKTLTILDTLLQQSDVTVYEVGTSLADDYSELLVKSKRMYLFSSDCVLENDSTIYAYGPAFIIDAYGDFRTNGIWVYTEFYREGVFPFTKQVQVYKVDSIPAGWQKELPTEEGIYFYKDNKLELLSTEQSEEAFKDKKWNGFYFIPNKGRLFRKIYLKGLE